MGWFKPKNCPFNVAFAEAATLITSQLSQADCSFFFQFSFSPFTVRGRILPVLAGRGDANDWSSKDDSKVWDSFFFYGFNTLCIATTVPVH